MAALAIQQRETTLDVSMSPTDKLRQFRELQKLTDNEHGMAYLQPAEGPAQVIVKSLDGRHIAAVTTRLSKEEYGELLKRLLPIPETRHILFELAVAYSNRTPIMLEGGTAIGKTFAVNRFAEILYGLGAKIPDFYCNGQTDVSELMGKYVPAGLRTDQILKISRYLESDAGAALKAELEQKGVTAPHEVMEHAALQLRIPIQRGSFTFQLGILPRSMTSTMGADGLMIDTPDGPGCMLHLQEVGMAAPAVINALLKIRGEKGQLTTDIQVHEDGGRLITSGSEWFIVLSTNPPGKGFKERFEIDSALSRALVWKTLDDGLSTSSMHAVARKIFDFSRIDRREGSPSAVVDLSSHSELAQHLGDVALEFHLLYQQKLIDGEPGRRQKIPATIDSLWKLAQRLQNDQTLHAEKDCIDFEVTLKDAIKSLYIDALQDKPSLIEREQLSAQAQERLSLGQALVGSLDAILNDRTKEIEFRGFKQTRAEILQHLSAEVFESSKESNTEASTIEVRALDAKARIDLETSLKALGELLHGDAVNQITSKVRGN